MAGPAIERVGGLYRLAWVQDEIKAEVSHLRQHRDGNLSAEVLISSKTGPQVDANLNLSSLPTRKQWAKTLAERWPALDGDRWEEIMEELCRGVKALSRQGEPATLATTEDEVEPPKDFIGPILPLGHTTVLFGDGETAKTTFATVLGVVAWLPWRDNPLGLATLNDSVEVLYLDWEAERADLQWRLKQLRNGMDLPYVQIHHRRCVQPLADDFDAIRRRVMETEAQFIIVDSAALAAGLGSSQGDPAGPPSALYAALREIGGTHLVIAHTSKADRQGKGASPYSSVFFRNLPRSVWQTKLTQGNRKGLLNLLLIHDKANLTAHHDPLGFTLDFSGDSLAISPSEPMEQPDFAESLSLPKRILCLLRDGPYTRDELAEELNLSPKDGNLKKALQRLVKSKQLSFEGASFHLGQNVPMS